MIAEAAKAESSPRRESPEVELFDIVPVPSSSAAFSTACYPPGCIALITCLEFRANGAIVHRVEIAACRQKFADRALLLRFDTYFSRHVAQW